MPKLPSAQNVSKVSARITADPGVQAPAKAFESPLGIAAEELLPAVKEFEAVQLRQDNRRDTTDRSKKINQYNRDADNKLSQLNAEEDLSDDEVLGKYGAFLNERRQTLLGEHGGSEDSLAKLTVRLQDIEAAATGRAAGISAKIGLDNIDTTFNEGLTPITTNVAQNPSLQNIDKGFTALETQLDDIGESINPQKEQKLRQSGREQIVLSAIEPLIIRGRVESVMNLMEAGGLATSLSSKTQRLIRRRIETVRFNRDETRNKLTERQRRINQLTDRGFSLALSQDLAAKDVKITAPDKFGDIFSVNVVTGVKTKIEGDEKQAVTDVISGGQQEPPTRSLEEDVEKATGPFSKIQAGLSNVFGPLAEGALFKNTTSARQQVRTFNQIAKSGLVNNPRFPVAEQQIVQTLLPDVDQFFNDPDTARANLKELNVFLKKNKGAKEKQLNKGKVSAQRKADLTDQISRIEELLSLMEGPATVKILGKDIAVGEIVTNNKGEKGRVESDGSITPIE